MIAIPIMKVITYEKGGSPLYFLANTPVSEVCLDYRDQQYCQFALTLSINRLLTRFILPHFLVWTKLFSVITFLLIKTSTIRSLLWVVSLLFNVSPNIFTKNCFTNPSGPNPVHLLLFLLCWRRFLWLRCLRCWRWFLWLRWTCFLWLGGWALRLRGWALRLRGHVRNAGGRRYVFEGK